MRRSTATERTDLEAMRIGLPAAWASMKRALASQRVEVDEGEGRGDRVEDRLVASVERLAVGCGGRDWGAGAGRTHRGASVSSAGRRLAKAGLESVPDPGEVAEWLKALAC